MAARQLDIRSGYLDLSALAAGRTSLQHLRARDLDGDSDRDLILESVASVPVAVWINDGAGNFHRANPDDFRFQLSHESSQTIEAVRRLLLSEVSDDRPRDDAVASAVSVRIARRLENTAPDFRTAPLSGRRADARSRAPPSSV